MASRRPAKRRRVSTDTTPANGASSRGTESDSDIGEPHGVGSECFPNDSRLLSLERAVTPPPVTATFGVVAASLRDEMDVIGDDRTTSDGTLLAVGQSSATSRTISSPVSLTRIRDLPATHNIDTVTLSDILGNPLIKEAWIFNYLHDVSFTMSHFDSDVRDSVRVKIVHGSWKREDTHRVAVEEGAKRYENVQVILAHMPEMFGTHHSKVVILIRHDDLAQVVIHTANMIPQDWANMTQAVWRSPLLPRLPQGSVTEGGTTVGSGEQFKTDLLNYLLAYQGRTKPLVEQLKQHDFSAVRAALIASVPCKQLIDSVSPLQTRFGWSGLRHVLKHVPTRTADEEAAAQVVIQISSVGNLGTKDKWLDPFLKTLAVTADSRASNVTFSAGFARPNTSQRPRYHIVFPTSDEVRRSLDGYASGASIHMKLESKAMQTQLAYMRPMLRHWAGDRGSKAEKLTNVVFADPQPAPQPRHALRRRAAPHIKTYVRYADADMTRIDWAMVTSANLSKQAWGEAAKEGKDGRREIRIASYELGVLVWPALFEDDESDMDVVGRAEDGPAQHSVQLDGKAKVAMVPTFGKDLPDEAEGARRDGGSIVGFRVPYDLPLVPYALGDDPWCATAAHKEPDWKGVVWEGYSRRS